MLARLSRALFGALLTSTLLATTALAQAPLELPRPSPLARVMQQVGLTEVTVEYSSPAVAGRKVYGELVPFGELWRAGANAATKVTFSRDVKVGGQDVPAGTYALFAIPNAAEWTIILNKNANQGGTRDYDQKLDQVRITAKPQTIPARERMTFIFANTTDNGTSIDLEWDTTRVSIPVATETEKHALANIDAAVGAGWRPYANSARYFLESGKDLDRAQKLIDQAIGLQETWFSVWIKAQIHHKKGDKKGALANAKRAHELGMKDTYFFWKAEVEKALEEWK
jgi:hypothetical protein